MMATRALRVRGGYAGISTGKIIHPPQQSHSQFDLLGLALNRPFIKTPRQERHAAAIEILSRQSAS